MALNMPGQMTRPASLELVDEILNANVKDWQRMIYDIVIADLASEEPQGIGQYLRHPELFELGTELASQVVPPVTDYDQWVTDFVEHIEEHWYGTDPDENYFASTLTREEKLRIISRGYLEALSIAIDNPGHKIVSFNLCAGNEFEVYVASPSSGNSESNQITCILLTGSLAKKAQLPPEPGPVNHREPRPDLLEAEGIICIASSARVEDTIRRFRRQGKPGIPENGGINTYRPWRLKLTSVKHDVEDAPH